MSRPVTKNTIFADDAKILKRIERVENALRSGLVGGGAGGGGGGPLPLGGVLTGDTDAAAFAQDMAYQSELDTAITNMNTALAGKASIGHIHDDRYYTEAEIDTKFGAITGEGFDTLHLGAIISWSRKGSFPWGYVLANGARYTRAAYPQGYDMAKVEADAGNTDYTYRTSDETFTVPDYSDRFIYSAGAKAAGTRGGLEDVTLSTAQMPAHAHGVNDPGHSHSIYLFPGGSPGGSTPAMRYETQDNVGWSNYNQMIDTRGTGISINNAGGGGSHTNMPPYVVLAQLVKIAGITVVNPTTIQGPPGVNGAQGVDGAPGGFTLATIPAVKATHTADQYVGNTNMAQGLSFNTELYDTDGMWDPAQQDRFLVNTAGLYLVEFMGHTLNPAGDRTAMECQHYKPDGTGKNGSGALSYDYAFLQSLDEGQYEMTGSAVINARVGDYVRFMWGSQNGAGLRGNNNYSPLVSMTWLGSGRGVNGSQATPVCALTHSVSQPIPDSGGFTGLAFDTKLVDTDNMLAVANRITIKTAGFYTVVLDWLQSGGAGERFAQIMKNGATEIARTMMPAFANDATGAPLVIQDYFAAGDYLEAKLGSYQKGSASSANATPYLRFSAAQHSGPSKAVIPSARVYRNATTALTSGAENAIVFTTARANNDNAWAAATNPSRVYCRTPGVYDIKAHLKLAANVPAGQRVLVFIKINGANFIAGDEIGPGTAHKTVSCEYELSANDYVELIVYPTTTGISLLASDAAANQHCQEFSVVKAGLSGQSGVSNSANWAVNGNDIQATNSGKVVVPNGIKVEDWHFVGSGGVEPGFLNGWINLPVGSGGDPVGNGLGFYKDPFGLVRLKGIVTSGTSGNLFQLPSGYRPLTVKRLLVPHDGGTILGSVGTDGMVTTNIAKSSGGWASLDNFVFRAEQ